MFFRPQDLHPFRPLRLGAVCAGLIMAVAIAVPAGAANHSVTVVNSVFQPSQLTIQVGDSVTWTKAATSLPHNAVFPGNVFCANGCSDAGGNGTPTTAPWSFTRTFSTAGQVLFFCQIHGNAAGNGMAGRITVEGAPAQPGALRFSNASYSRNEGGGVATITVQRISGTDGAVSVHYATGGGSASAGIDYAATSGTLDWGNNDGSAKTFNVAIFDDTADEPNETVGLTLSNPTGGAVLGNPSSATLTIVDNDDSGPGPSAGSLRFSVGTQSVPENGGPATVAVQRFGGTAGVVSVLYESANGTATAGDDYTAVSGALSWGGGNGADKTFEVPIADDGDTENNETLTLMLSAPTGGATLATPSTQTVTILDNDSAVPGPCIEDGHTLCLLGERFRVEVTFKPPGGVEGPANAIPFTDRAGMFWFFNAANIEMLVKMQNACVAPFNRFWVFYAATTNVEFHVTVTDTDAVLAKHYDNPQGMVALPQADTQAFSTCP